MIGSILFRSVPQKNGESESVMCIPPSKIECILDYYHSFIIGGHQGITKTLQTLNSRYYYPRMGDYVRSYIVGCHMCQLFKDSKRFHRPFQKRVYDISQPALTNVSMDIKYMPKSTKGFKFLLVILCEITNFLVTHPMKDINAAKVCTILVDEFIAYFNTQYFSTLRYRSLNHIWSQIGNIIFNSCSLSWSCARKLGIHIIVRNFS